MYHKFVFFLFIIKKLKAMKNIRSLLFLSLMLIVSTCNDREDYFASSIKNVSVALESPLTACTSTYPGFINLDYAFNFRLTPEYAKADPLPLVAQYTCENANTFELSFGNKRYSPSDTIMFKSLSKNMMLNVSKPGIYRFFIHFFKENQKDEILGKYEFTFVIGIPDLNIYIVRDGKRMESLDETPNLLGQEGSFIVRVNSEKEELNNERLTLTTNMTGSSVIVKNWKNNEVKSSQNDDLPKMVDFFVEYQNALVGETEFVFTAQSQNSIAVLRSSMNVQENFSIELAPGNPRESASAYQNETITAFQLKYKTPSILADDYTITVTSNNEDVADVFLMNKDLLFRKTLFGVAEIPPASHNSNGSLLSADNSGLIQIKGKKPGIAILSFTLIHKASGVSGTITKTVTTIADPVQFVIEPAPTIDAKNIERDAIPFGGVFHTYQNPRFKIRLLNNSDYPENTQGVAIVTFSTAPSLINVAQLTISGGVFDNIDITHDTPIHLFYDMDYFVTVSAPTSLPWDAPVGTEPFLNIRMTKATNLQTPIVAEYDDIVKYRLRAYKIPTYKITAENYNEIFIGSTTQTLPAGISADVPEAGVKILPRGIRGVVTKTNSNGTFHIKNIVVSPIETGDTCDEIIYSIDIPSFGYFDCEKFVGYHIELLAGYTVSDPNWDKNGPGVEVTSYHHLSAIVRDNWGYNSNVTVTFPKKIIYGW